MITGRKVILREKALVDAQDDNAWQADPELARLDAVLSPATTFAQHWADYAVALHRSSLTRHQFAIDTLDGKHIGNCSCYNIDKAKDEAERKELIEKGRQLRAQKDAAQREHDQREEELKQLLEAIPNLTHAEVPTGGEEDAVDVTNQALDALVRRLRDRLAMIDPTHQYLVTVRGHGLRMENPKD